MIWVCQDGLTGPACDRRSKAPAALATCGPHASAAWFPQIPAPGANPPRKPLSPTMSRDHSECFALYLQISSSSSDRRTPRRAASPPRQPSSGTRNRFRIYCATLPLWGSSDTQRYCPDYAARIAGFGARRRRAIGPAVGIPSAKCTFCPRGGTAAAASRTARVREGRHRGQTAGSGSRARVRLAHKSPARAGGRGGARRRDRHRLVAALARPVSPAFQLRSSH